MINILMLVLALCTDTFVASLAYGSNHVSVAWKKAALLNGICSGCLGLALCLGGLIQSFVPAGFTKAVCFVSLFLLGVVKLLDYSIKKYINTHCRVNKNIRFNLSGLKIIINIYGDPMAADWDDSKSLSWNETIFLGVAMSIDSLVAGTMAAFMDIPAGLTVGVSFIVGMTVMFIGLLLGRRLAAGKDMDLSWLSGLLFILLAVSKTF